MTPIYLCAIMLLSLVGCYKREDPLVRAAQDLRQLSYEFAEREEERLHRFRSLELGLSDDEVLARVGPPSSRQSLTSDPEERRELWTYQRGLTPPTLLTFTNRRLTSIRLE